MSRHRTTGPWLAAGALAAAALMVTACTSQSSTTAEQRLDSGDWQSVLRQAEGQTVNWYMYGGDETLNGFVTGYVADRLAELGVTLNQVPVTDTADAVNKVLGEKQAGRSSGGSVDAIWINGENFATGVQADLWSCGWVRRLPNSRFVDFTRPAVNNDFGTPVRGCEAPWQEADSALVYDSDQLSQSDVESVSSLLGWAAAHPGRFTYPALPDFTGSMAVRTILYDTIGGPDSLTGPFEEDTYTAATGRLWPRLNAIGDSLWRGGSTYPRSQADVEKLFGDGEISAFFTYGPGAVADQVKKGVYPGSTREAVLDGGNIGNVSFLAIPANAAHSAAALVLANILLDPKTQLALYGAEGIYPVIDVERTDKQTQQFFADVPRSPSVLPLSTLTQNTQPELGSDYVTRLERDWQTNVLQK